MAVGMPSPFLTGMLVIGFRAHLGNCGCFFFFPSVMSLSRFGVRVVLASE